MTAVISSDQIDVYDPAGYEASEQHETFARLRREQPVFRQPMPDGTFYWAVMRHADVVAVSRAPEVFSAEIGGVVLEDMPPKQLEQTDAPRRRRSNLDNALKSLPARLESA